MILISKINNPLRLILMIWKMMREMKMTLAQKRKIQTFHLSHQQLERKKVKKG